MHSCKFLLFLERLNYLKYVVLLKLFKTYVVRNLVVRYYLYTYVYI